jgi:uncharacterized glyoxalase superfamily protein PhnB
MRDKTKTLDYYRGQLGFKILGNADYEDYLMLRRDEVEIHFFLYPDLRPEDNYGMVYIRTGDIDNFYRSLLDRGVPIHPNAPLQQKPWGQKEFALLDPDNNLLTFGQAV